MQVLPLRSRVPVIIICPWIISLHERSDALSSLYPHLRLDLLFLTLFFSIFRLCRFGKSSFVYLFLAEMRIHFNTWTCFLTTIFNSISRKTIIETKNYSPHYYWHEKNKLNKNCKFYENNFFQFMFIKSTSKSTLNLCNIY